ncbi:MAG TPA: PEP-CTERM sorting domain-containing protein, partial [Thermoanaerobaculia bacterium]|nr:PEP-CTERM sorting domain-containing protein [Thermoanaerobaculia bacterium]
MKVLPTACAVSLIAAALLPFPPADAALVGYEAAGSNVAAIQPTVDAFRTALGGALNGVGNPKPDGRREINWDGVPAQFLDSLPPAFFNTNSARGLVLSTPGSRLKVSGDSGTTSFLMKDVTAQAWGETEFDTFSPQKLFAPIGSTVTDVIFFVPGTSTRATVTGFGAVFVDVDVANTSRVEAFDAAGRLLFSRPVLQSGVASKGLSFLGVLATGTERIARVRLTNGSGQIDAPFQDPPPDGVALDDFIYGEPQTLAEPLS